MYTLKFSQKLPLTIEACWEFFSSPLNLKKITPEHLRFDMTLSGDVVKMYPGQMIGYYIRPLGNIPIEWVTEITHVHEPHYFIDEQRIGPYKLWHHEHRFNQIPSGVEIIDIVHYKMPFGILGKALHFLKVKKDIEEIFSYRASKLISLFGEY